VGLALEARQYGVQVVNEGSPSCSVSMQGEVQVLWYTVPPGPPCDTGGNADSLLTTWRQWVDAYNPDVVVYLARGETFNQQVGGAWQNLGEPAFDSYVTSRFNSAAEVLGSRGAAVVLLTVPYFDSGVSGAGTPWPENNPLRVKIDNAIMRGVAKTSSGNVSVFNLNALVSPDGHYSPTVGTVNVRCSDGVHFSQSGGIFVGMELAPELAALGQAHALASPRGTWPGPLPPPVPAWFSDLPCQ
jgi:lysophospholipase L1-like esterase